MEKQAEQLGNGLESMRSCIKWLLDHYADDQFAPNAVCYNLLMACSTVVAGWGMARSILAAKARLDGGDSDAQFLEGKLTTGRFFLDKTRSSKRLLQTLND